MPNWDEDSSQLRENLTLLLSDIASQARHRIKPSRELARGWQRSFMKGLDLPDNRYVGTFRGEPGLEHIEVSIGAFDGVPPAKVAQELNSFEDKLQQSIAVLDRMLAPGEIPDGDQLDAILQLCAWAHAEWVRIHPFANGNGRTARLWANWIAMRYSLPPFVRLRPRPFGRYGDAGAQAMQGNWRPTVAVFEQLLNDCLSDPPPPRIN